ncbi:hypothetical protein UFOVP531_26 [uncultured Caudovirales phage]|uniref:Uncharacterized protein n=1 Tax=uncultured Caudovirales phage TaxID=2100421 RepID=A0A6J5MUR7_9CAUD|nr:hypothetical protein UFOVP531_26 [uncultured Caudovirales phage]
MTAVEWLEQEIFRRYKFTFQQLNCGPLEEAIQQAKEIEKQQIENAFNNGYYQETIGYNASEEYYNKTFNNK